LGKLALAAQVDQAEALKEMVAVRAVTEDWLLTTVPVVLAAAQRDTLATAATADTQTVIV
jgi:hypothetical protein